MAALLLSRITPRHGVTQVATPPKPSPRHLTLYAAVAELLQGSNSSTLIKAPIDYCSSDATAYCSSTATAYYSSDAGGHWKEEQRRVVGVDRYSQRQLPGGRHSTPAAISSGFLVTANSAPPPPEQTSDSYGLWLSVILMEMSLRMYFTYKKQQLQAQAYTKTPLVSIGKNLEAKIESYLKQEKETRLAGYVTGIRDVVISIIKAYYEARPWKTLNEQIVLLSK